MHICDQCESIIKVKHPMIIFKCDHGNDATIPFDFGDSNNVQDVKEDRENVRLAVESLVKDDGYALKYKD